MLSTINPDENFTNKKCIAITLMANPAGFVSDPDRTRIRIEVLRAAPTGEFFWCAGVSFFFCGFCRSATIGKGPIPSWQVRQPFSLAIADGAIAVTVTRQPSNNTILNRLWIYQPLTSGCL